MSHSLSLPHHLLVLKPPATMAQSTRPLKTRPSKQSLRTHRLYPHTALREAPNFRPEAPSDRIRSRGEWRCSWSGFPGGGFLISKQALPTYDFKDVLQLLYLRRRSFSPVPFSALYREQFNDLPCNTVTYLDGLDKVGGAVGDLLGGLDKVPLGHRVGRLG